MRNTRFSETEIIYAVKQVKNPAYKAGHLKTTLFPRKGPSALEHSLSLRDTECICGSSPR